MPPRSLDQRIENVASWLAAAVLTTVAVVYAVRRDEQRQQHHDDFISGLTPATEPLSLQVARAAEAGRGRQAASPLQIPWAGWRDIFWRTYEQIQDDRLLALAAGVVFYGLVALFPAIAAGVSSYALFANAATIATHLSLLTGVVPSDTLDLLVTEITRIATRSEGKLTFGFVVGLGVALWSANAGMKAIFDALNIIYDEEEKRGIVWLNAVSLFFTFCAIAGALLSVGAVVVFPLVMAALGFSSLDAPIIGILRWPALVLLLIAGLAVLYRFGPSRRRARWRWLTVGSVFAAVTWLLMSTLFSWYLANFASYNATYGSLGAVVGLMMWMWLTTVVVLVGAELNSEIEHQTARDTTVGGPKPLGTRGAVMADTVGART